MRAATSSRKSRLSPDLRIDRRTILRAGAGLCTSAFWPPALADAGIRRWRLYAPCRYGQLHIHAAEPAGESPAAPAVVCLHKSPTSGLDYRELQAVLATDRLVLCPDTAGYGQSDRPPAQPDIGDYAAALGDALAALGFGSGAAGPVDVLGFHTGACIALALARRCPDLVRRLVLPGIPFFPAAERESLRKRFGKPRPYFSDPDYVGTSYRNQVVDGDPRIPVALRHEFFVAALLAGPGSHYGLDAVFRYPIDTALRETAQATLVPVFNETLADQTRAAATLLPNVRLAERPDLDAYSWQQQPAEIAALLRDFLDDNSISGASDPVGAVAGCAEAGRAPAAKGMRRHYADNRYGQMHFASSGTSLSGKPPLVLLHQSPLSGVIFEELQAELGADRLVHAADTPGFGASDGPSTPPTMADYGAATAEALRSLRNQGAEPGPVDLFGFHTGAFVAAEVARQAPELVRRLILCGVPYYPADERLARQAEFLRPYAFYTDPDYVAGLYRRIVVDGDPAVPERRRLQRFTDRLRAGPEGEWGPCAVFAYDADAGLRAINRPTLLLTFDEVMTQPTRMAQALLPQAEFRHLPGVPMMGFMTQPGRVAAAMRDYLDAPLTKSTT